MAAYGAVGKCARILTVPKAHSKINLYARSGRSYELSVVVVNVMDASCETMRPSFNDTEAISKQIEKSDIVFLECDGASKVLAFTTCSYQTVNSRTVAYALSASLRSKIHDGFGETIAGFISWSKSFHFLESRALLLLKILELSLTL